MRPPRSEPPRIDARLAHALAWLRRPLAGLMAVWLLATVVAAGAAPRLHPGPSLPSSAAAEGYVLLCTPTGVKLVALNDAARPTADAAAPAANVAGAPADMAGPAADPLAPGGLLTTTPALDCPGCLTGCLGLALPPTADVAPLPQDGPALLRRSADGARAPADAWPHARPPARAPPAPRPLGASPAAAAAPLQTLI